jgi:hypothetical protein
MGQQEGGEGVPSGVCVCVGGGQQEGGSGGGRGREQAQAGARVAGEERGMLWVAGEEAGKLGAPDTGLISYGETVDHVFLGGGGRWEQRQGRGEAGVVVGMDRRKGDRSRNRCSALYEERQTAEGAVKLDEKVPKGERRQHGQSGAAGSKGGWSLGGGGYIMLRPIDVVRTLLKQTLQ